MRHNKRNQENKLNNRKDMFQDSSSLSEREWLLKEERKKRIRKKLIAVAVVEVLILMMMSYAWYYYLSHRNVKSEEREVMPPYYLYLVNPNGEDALQLTVGNLHPGETKQIIFGVSNKEPQTDSEASYKVGKNSSFNYELELAYTQNLPVNYQVYELTKVDDQGNDTVVAEWKDSNNNIVKKYFTKTSLAKNSGSSDFTNQNNIEMYGSDKVKSTINLGQYDLYDTGSGNKKFDLTTTVTDGNVTFDLDYYMIEIKWKDGIEFSDYLKETDLVYVIVKAMQLEPEEATQQQ